MDWFIYNKDLHPGRVHVLKMDIKSDFSNEKVRGQIPGSRWPSDRISNKRSDYHRVSEASPLDSGPEVAVGQPSSR